MPGNVAEHVPFRSDTSVFDGDVILFRPSFGDDYQSYEWYNGKPLIAEFDSPKISSDCKHWSSELKAAVEAGKTVFIFLTKPHDVYYHTGERTFSGTGRSRVTTQHVAPISSYDAIPLRLSGLIPRGGKEISTLRELGPLSVYWSEFGSQSAYEVHFDGTGLDPLLGTKKRERVVGAQVRTKGGGALVFLPPVQWDVDALTYSRGKSTFWRKDAVALGSRFVKALVSASEAFRRAGRRTPTPEWVLAPEYVISSEDKLRSQIAVVDRDIGRLSDNRRALQTQLEEAGDLRALLYETGKPLEAAVLKALRLLGFQAEPFSDPDYGVREGCPLRKCSTLVAGR